MTFERVSITPQTCYLHLKCIIWWDFSFLLCANVSIDKKANIISNADIFLMWILNIQYIFRFLCLFLGISKDDCKRHIIFFHYDKNIIWSLLCIHNRDPQTHTRKYHAQLGLFAWKWKLVYLLKRAMFFLLVEINNHCYLNRNFMAPYS
jgi:hypothetical protein